MKDAQGGGFVTPAQISDSLADQIRIFYRNSPPSLPFETLCECLG